MRHCGIIAAFVISILTTSPASAQHIIAHRGASHDAPENTLAAFELAWEQKADGIEGDFYLTKDNQIACIHDKTTKRTAPDHAELKVADSTLAELRSLDVGSWKNPRFAGERVPTLDEVLQTVPEGRQIYVEIKCGPEILPVLKPQLAQSGLQPEQIVIISFNQDVITQSRKLMPQYDANWLTSFKQKANDGDWKPTRQQVIDTLVDTGSTGLGSRGELQVLDAAFVDALRSRGLQFHVWTINDPTAARTLQALGAESITTDRPAFLRQGLAIPAQ